MDETRIKTSIAIRSSTWDVFATIAKKFGYDRSAALESLMEAVIVGVIELPVPGNPWIKQKAQKQVGLAGKGQQQIDVIIHERESNRLSIFARRVGAANTADAVRMLIEQIPVTEDERACDGSAEEAHAVQDFLDIYRDKNPKFDFPRRQLMHLLKEIKIFRKKLS